VRGNPLFSDIIPSHLPDHSVGIGTLKNGKVFWLPRLHRAVPSASLDKSTASGATH